MFGLTKVRHICIPYIQWPIFRDNELDSKLHNEQHSSFLWKISFLFVQLMAHVIAAEIQYCNNVLPWLTADSPTPPAVCLLSETEAVKPWNRSLTVVRHPDVDPDRLTAPVACCPDLMRSSFTPAALEKRMLCWPSGKSRNVILMSDWLGKCAQL